MRIPTGILCLAFLLLLAGSSFRPIKKKKPDPYLFAYFLNDGASGLHLACSEDGMKWTPLKGGKTVIKPAIGDYVMREPHLSQTPDGIFHLVWATGQYRKDLGYAWSKDLLEWSAQRLIPVMEKDTVVLNAWSPELYYDAASLQFNLIWASTVPKKFRDTDNSLDSLPSGYHLNHRIYRKTSTDLRTWSETQLFYDPGFSCTDATIATDSGKTMLFVKDETRLAKVVSKRIKMATGTSISGPFGAVGPGLTGKYFAASPTALRVDSQFVVYFDKYTKNRMGAVATRNFKKWDDVSDSLSFPKGVHPGSILQLNRKLMEKLQEN